ncbi:MAG: hypothetical protein JWR38_594 [Mucilaginibacter sp.]|nr:hypothetical protein [Mucilaginibacter sp.]
MDKTNNSEPEEISIKDILKKYKLTFKYLKSKWIIIVMCGILGGLLGFVYSVFKKPVFTAACTFVLEDGKSSSPLGQYAGLASLAGIDLGGGGGGNGGVFTGDNIFELYKSRTMIEKALLSEIVINNKKQLLIDRYINDLKLRDLWKKNDGIDDIDFHFPPDKFNRKQDSIISDIADKINKNILSISKLDKKLSIVNVEVKFSDELFAKEFNNKLVETVNDFYIKTKVKKNQQNVNLLQKQVDSVKRILNNSIGGVASALDAAPNANPLLTSLRVPSQKKQIDVQASTSIYAEMVKNLELSKMSLRQEMPLIQVIDSPVLPLKVDKLGKVRALLTGFLIGSLICAMFFLFKRFTYSLLN